MKEDRLNVEIAQRTLSDLILRRGWDSNPRWEQVPQRFSRPPHSAALAPLRFPKHAGLYQKWLEFPLYERNSRLFSSDFAFLAAQSWVGIHCRQGQNRCDSQDSWRKQRVGSAQPGADLFKHAQAWLYLLLE